MRRHRGMPWGWGCGCEASSLAFSLPLSTHGATWYCPSEWVGFGGLPGAVGTRGGGGCPLRGAADGVPTAWGAGQVYRAH